MISLAFDAPHARRQQRIDSAMRGRPHYETRDDIHQRGRADLDRPPFLGASGDAIPSLPGSLS